MIAIKMTPEEFQAKAAQLKEQAGIDLQGDKGTAAGHGVTVNYAYDGTTLSLDVTHKPFFVSVGYCEDQINKWLATN